MRSRKDRTQSFEHQAEAIARGDSFSMFQMVFLQLASLVVGLGQIILSPISWTSEVAMYISDGGFQDEISIRYDDTRASMDANCNCDFRSNFTDESAKERRSFMHAVSGQMISATSGKAEYFSVVDEVSRQFAVEQFATGNECVSDAGMNEQRHLVLGWFNSISGVACEGANFQTSVQQLLNAVGVVYQWGLSVSDFIEQFVDIEVFLTVTFVVLATGWLLTRKYPCRWMFLALMVVLNSVGQEWTLLVCGVMVMFDVAFEHIDECRKRWKAMSRIEKRRSHLGRGTCKKHLKVLCFVMMIHSAKGMDQQAFLDQVVELTRAATTAASSAASAMQSMQQFQQGKGSSASGLESASRILKNPDVFSGDNPLEFLSWKSLFESWLTFGDSRYGDILTKLEGMKDPPKFDTYTEDQKMLSTRFFAILSSYLRGRCSALVRSHNKLKDGFGLWFSLCQEYVPSTKQRSLSLAQALSSFPNFNSKLTLLENILQYEQLVSSYETSSGSVYPPDLKTATLIRCAPAKVRDHIQLSLRDDSSYSDVREALLSFDRVTRGFSAEAIMKQLTYDSTSAERRDDGGVRDMEVDRVEWKGGKGYKGKEKGKNKNGFPYEAAWSAFGRGRGFGKGKSKGKDKSKGKGKNKTKNKSKKGQKGKGQNRGCWNCGDPNHFAKNCPQNRGRVNQVEGDGGWMNENYNVPQNSQQPERASGSNGQVNQVQQSSNFGGQQQQQQQQQSTKPVVRRIFNLGVSAMSSGDSVRMISNGGVGSVNNEGRQLNIILDSGSDVSLLPESFAPDTLTDNSAYKLKDCQGQKLTVRGLKRAELLLCDEFGEEVLLKQNFVIGQVTNGILSLGQLMKRGWTLPAGNSPSGTVLQSPDGSLRLPIAYQGSSLAISAHVRCIKSEETDVEEVSIRAIVSVHDELDSADMGMWNMTNDNVAFMKYRGHDHADGRGFWGHYYPFRTTLISVDHQGRKAWKLVELNHDYLDDDDCGKPISECGGASHDILVLLSGSKRGLEVFMKENLDNVDPPAELFEAPAPAEADDDVEVLLPAPEAEAQQGPDIGVALNPPVAVPESIVIQDVELRANSSAYDLRQAAKFLGISQAGSKRKIYERVCTSHLLALRRQAVEVAEEAYQRDVVEPRVSLPVRQPSDRERMLHNMTHIPYRSWCPHCIACKAHDDHHPKVPPERAADREFPVIQLDLFYGSGGSIHLLLIDMWTRYTQIVPLRMKSASVIATAIINFLGLLGYFQQVEVSCDNENVLVAGVNQAKVMRNKVGATLIPQFGKNYSKGRTAMAERAIQTVRNQGKTLIHCLEDFAKIKLPEKHVLHSWSYFHAGWLLNHFHVHSALKCTPYQTLMGRPYRGRICGFGTVAFGLDGAITKNKPTWVRGIWVGKDRSDQDLLITGDGRILRAKAVRQTGDLWDAEALSAIEIGPGDLLKTYTHSTVRLPPGLPPLPAPVDGVAETEDEAGLDSPTEQGREMQEEEETSASPSPSPSPQQPSEQPDPLPEQSSAMPSLPQTEPSSQLAGDDAGTVDKRPLEEGEISPRMKKRTSKIHFDMKTNTHKVVYTDVEEPAKKPKPLPLNIARSDAGGVKHAGEASSSGRPEKSSRTGEGLSSSPTFAGNINRVKTYSGIEMWVDDEEPFEAGFEEDIEKSVFIEDYMDDIDEMQFPSEADGPPDLSASELEMLDNEAGIEEITRLF